MTLDEMEKMARNAVDEVDGEESLNEIALGRALLLVLPTIRDALAWRDGHDAKANGCRYAVALAESIDTLRATLAKDE